MTKSPMPGDYRKNQLNEPVVLGFMDPDQAAEGSALTLRINQVPLHFWPAGPSYVGLLRCGRQALLGSSGRRLGLSLTLQPASVPQRWINGAEGDKL